MGGVPLLRQCCAKKSRLVRVPIASSVTPSDRTVIAIVLAAARVHAGKSAQPPQAVLPVTSEVLAASHPRARTTMQYRASLPKHAARPSMPADGLAAALARPPSPQPRAARRMHFRSLRATRDQYREQ